MYRDVFRVVGLSALGRTALMQGDLEAARVAFKQAVLHLEGRPDARSSGILLIQALAGLAQATADRAFADQARELWDDRSKPYRFETVVVATLGITQHELARAYAAVGDMKLANESLEGALYEGAGEAEALIARGEDPLRYPAAS